MRDAQFAVHAHAAVAFKHIRALIYDNGSRCDAVQCGMRDAGCAMRDAPCAMHARAHTTRTHNARTAHARAADSRARTHARRTGTHGGQTRRTNTRRTRAHARTTHARTTHARFLLIAKIDAAPSLSLLPVVVFVIFE